VRPGRIKNLQRNNENCVIKALLDELIVSSRDEIVVEAKLKLVPENVTFVNNVVGGLLLDHMM
jgi:hypothetical protein